MNKIITIFLAVLCAGVPARAQKAPLSPAALEMDKVGAVWFNSDNAAGIILTPTASFEAVDVGYDIADGSYRRYADGNNRTLGVNAEGATRLGKGRVWGEFSYRNITSNNCKYNTLFLNMDDEMPFYVADDIESFWKKQRYEMSMKGASPLIRDKFAFGIEAGYFCESGAKQIDPRGYGYEYGVEVKPSAIISFGKHALGLTLSYENGNMRMSSINNALASSHLVYVLRGLGNYDGYYVSLMSTSALGLVYDKKNEFGGSVQYGYCSENANILAEVYGKYRNWELFQTPSKPRRIGTASRISLGFDIQAVLDGTDFLQRITAEGSFRNTNGIEYIQKLNKEYEVQAWETVGQSVKSTYQRIDASLGYDIYRKSGGSYSWAAGMDVIWQNLNDEYYLPSSKMDAGSINAEVFGKKNFIAGKVSIIPGVKFGYKKNLGSVYSYGGKETDSPIVTDLFPNTLAWLSADCFKSGLGVEISVHLFKSATMFAKADWQLLRASGAMSESRNIASASVGFIF